MRKKASLMQNKRRHKNQIVVLLIFNLSYYEKASAIGQKSYYIIQKQLSLTTTYCMIFLNFALYSIEIFKMTNGII